MAILLLCVALVRVFDTLTIISEANKHENHQQNKLIKYNASLNITTTNLTVHLQPKKKINQTKFKKISWTSVGKKELFQQHSPPQQVEPDVVVFKNISVRNVFIINNINAGGALKYVTDFTNSFKDVNFVFIKSLNMLTACDIKQGDILFVNHLLRTGIRPLHIIEYKKSINFKLVIAIHDFVWLKPFLNNVTTFTSEINMHGGYSLVGAHLRPSAVKLFDACDLIIHQSKFAYDTYSKLYSSYKSVYSFPNDFEIVRGKTKFLRIRENVINIGVFHAFSEYKGKHLVTSIMDTLKGRYKDYKVMFYISGQNVDDYEDSQASFNNQLQVHQIHGLLYLSRFGETYSYAMTKYLNSGLPILYNNIGSFKERLSNYSGVFKMFESEIGP